MAIKRAIFGHLTNAAAITALVSTRVYPVGETPEALVYPLITFERTGSNHARHMGGGAGLGSGTWQFYCTDKSADGAEQLAEALRELLDNFTGTLGSGANTVNCRGSFDEDEDDAFDAPIDASARGKFSVTVRFTIWHAETATPV